MVIIIRNKANASTKEIVGTELVDQVSVFAK